MIYGYVRVSTDMQDNANQRYEINNFCRREHIRIDKWVEETVSGAKDPDKRKLGVLLDLTKSGDLIICSEISRLGRSMFMVMDILKMLLERDVHVRTIKDNYRLDDSVQSKVLAFAFSLAAEIEREMISKRTKQALARLRENGVRIGRPFGSVNVKTKLQCKHGEIRKLVGIGESISDIARALNTSRETVRKELKRMGIDMQYPRKPIIYTSRGSVLDRYADTVRVMLDGGMKKVEMCRVLNVCWRTLDDFLGKRGWAGSVHPKQKVRRAA
jgi:DNA invertase Pin-like site-specific DNA recombinase